MVRKIKFILLFSLFIILGLCTQSQARITTSDPTVSSGGTATITINSQEPVAYGSIDVTSNGGLTFVSVSGGTANGTLVAFAGTENKTSGIATYTFRVPNVTETTTYKVTFVSADMGNANEEAVASSSATATVTVRAPSSSSTGNGGDSDESNSDNNSGGSSETNTPSFTEVNETVYATGSVNVRSSYSTSSSIIGSLGEGDSVTRTGRGSNGWSRVTYNGQTAYINSSYLTTEKPEESNNKNLEALSVGEGFTLTPEFSTDVTEYSLTVGADVTSLDITATAEDSKAEVEITGNDNLLMGENTIEIKVTAEDGTVRTYTINVTKSDETENVLGNELVLSELVISGYTLTPEFDSNVYEYTLNIHDTSVTSVSVEAKANAENAIIEIVGDDGLKLGENVVTVLVKSEDGIQTTTYQIIVNITEQVEEQIIAGIDNKDLFLYGGIALAVLVIIIIAIIIIRRKRRNDDEDDYEYYDGFAPLNDNNTIDNQDSIMTQNQGNNNIDNDFIKNEFEDKSEKIEEKETDLNEHDKKRKSVIEENFGADITPEDFENDEPRKKKGKHF